MEAVSKTWWLAAVLVYPQFKRASPFDLAVHTPAGLISHQPWYCSVIYIDWHVCVYIYIYIYDFYKVTGRGVCFWCVSASGGRISHLTLAHIAAFSFYLSRLVAAGLITDSAAFTTLTTLHSVSSPPVSWCVVGVLAQYGCRRIIQVDAAHWCGCGDPPFL